MKNIKVLLSSDTDEKITVQASFIWEYKSIFLPWIR